MKYSEQKKRYPILAIRMVPREMKYLRRVSKWRGITVAEYVRAVLELPSKNKN